MSFRRYDHVERVGHPNVQDIEIGEVHVFPKLDGSCGVIWSEDGWIKTGSRNRQLGLVNGEARDNHGFNAWAVAQEKFVRLFQNFPHWILYAEWMVPHTLKTYQEGAWRRAWVFDVWDSQEQCYVPYSEYEPVLRDFEIDLIPPLCTMRNPSEAQLYKQLESNFFLIRDGQGTGEGIVIKNYEWKNAFGRQPWAKIVRNDFKEENRRAFGTPEKHGEWQLELEIAERYVTPGLVEKERSKIRLAIVQETGAPLEDAEALHRKQLIPRLLSVVFKSIVEEELWAIVKKYNNPTINFQLLQRHVIYWTKKHAADLF